MVRKTSSKTTVVVSYLRYSRPEQLKGDSIRRQLALSREWAAARGLTIDDSISDKGISAFRGANATTGALASFLRLVEKGSIPRGSVLLVESLDRLSRTEVLDAFQQFIGIVNAGVKIVTLGDKREYERVTLNANFSELMYSLMVMSRAHEESAVKAQRLSEAWKGKRLRIAEKPLTKLVPAWCRVEGNKIVLDKTKAAVVKRIFKLAAQGHGLNQITRKLNADTEGLARVKYFNRSYVFKILRNRAVLGEFQPHRNVYLGNKKAREPVGEPILDYYPRVVSDAEFYAAAGTITAKRKTGGRSAKFVNLFSGLLHSSEDKSRLQIQDKGYGRRYVSSAAILGRKGAAAFVGFPVSAFEKGMLLRLGDASMFAGAEDNSEEMHNAAAATEAQIAEVDGNIEKVNKSVADGGKYSPSVVALLNRMDARQTELQATLKRQKEALATAGGGDSVEVMVGLITKTLDGTFTDDERVQLRNAVRHLVEKIICAFRRVGRNYLCSSVIYLRNGNQLDFAFRADYVDHMGRDAKGHPVKRNGGPKEPQYTLTMIVE